MDYLKNVYRVQVINGSEDACIQLLNIILNLA